MSENNNNRCNKSAKKKKTRLEFLSSRFEDHYELTGVTLGSGTFSRVECCRQKRSLTTLFAAVKIIDKIEGLFRRCKTLNEIQTYHLCSGHPHIIQLLEYFESPAAFYLVFEKLDGGPLLDLIQKREFFSEQETRIVVQELALALSFLHDRGIAHRDVKPENVLCVKKDSVSPIKLCDFDLCSEKALAGYGGTSRGLRTPKLQTPVGSLEYMAPEVLETFSTIEHDFEDENEEEDSKWTYDKKCDIWSLGVLVYLLLSGKPPFTGDCGQDCGWNSGDACLDCQFNLSSKIKKGQVAFHEDTWINVSQEGKDLVASMLATDSSRRPTASQLLDHPWIVKKRDCANVRQKWRQTSLDDVNDFVKSTMLLNRAISLDENSATCSSSEEAKKKPQTRLMMHTNSVDINPNISKTSGRKSSARDFMKRRNIRFSRTLDLESTVKFSSIDE